MHTYDSTANALATKGYHAQCHCRGAGVFAVVLWNAKLKGGRQPSGSGASSLDALLAADEQRRKWEEEAK